jgi:hypothetical protein
MVHSPDSSTLSVGESFAYDDHEDDDDTDVDVDPPEAATGTFVTQRREDGDCGVLFCASDVWRACGTRGLCPRIIPSPHKHMVETLTTHAPDSVMMALDPYRKGSKVIDGLASSHRSEEAHQAELQRCTDENQAMARRLAEASPDNGRSYRNDDEDDEDAEDADADDEVETPVRTNRASRFAHPPARTHGRVPGSAPASLAGSGDRLPGRNGLLLTPHRPPADSAVTLETLTQLVQDSLQSQAALQERAAASHVLVETLLAHATYRDQVAQAMPTAPSIAPVVTTIDDDSDGPSREANGPKAKSRNGAKHGDKKTRGKKGRRDKAPSTWYGMVAGQHSSVRSTLSTAKAYAKSYDPRGKISSKFILWSFPIRLSSCAR